MTPLQAWLDHKNIQHTGLDYLVDAPPRDDFLLGGKPAYLSEYGLTPGSDRLMAKMIIGTDLNEGETSKPLQAPRSMRSTNILGSGLMRP